MYGANVAKALMTMTDTDKRKKRTGLLYFFLADALAGAGLYLGFRKLLWWIWAVISGLWIILIFGAKASSPNDLQGNSFWVVIIAPPILLLLLVGLINRIVNRLFRDEYSEKRVTAK